MPLFLIPNKKSTKTYSYHKLGQKDRSRRNNSYKKLLQAMKEAMKTDFFFNSVAKTD